MGVPWVSGNGEKHRAGRWEPRCRQKVLMRRFLTEILDGAKWVTQRNSAQKYTKVGLSNFLFHIFYDGYPLLI